MKVRVKIPQNNPNFDAEVNTKYVLGANNISGGTSVTVKIPGNSGNIISGEATSQFNIGKKWNITGGKIKGEIFERIKIDGDFSGSGEISANPQLKGRLNVEAIYNKKIFKAFPENFDPKNPTADNTIGGFAAAAEFNIAIRSKINAAIKASGFIGELKVRIKGVGKGSFKWPTSKVFVVLGSFEGKLNIIKKGNETIAQGKLTFSIPNFTPKTVDVDVTL